MLKSTAIDLYQLTTRKSISHHHTKSINTEILPMETIVGALGQLVTDIGRVFTVYDHIRPCNFQVLSFFSTRHCRVRRRHVVRSRCIRTVCLITTCVNSGTTSNLSLTSNITQNYTSNQPDRTL